MESIEGRTGVVLIRLFRMLMPSSERLFWISRAPAPMKSCPGGTPVVAFKPGITPGVESARRNGSRPFSGRSATSRMPTISETLASSVLMAGVVASTVTVSANSPTLRTTSFRTT